MKFGSMKIIFSIFNGHLKFKNCQKDAKMFQKDAKAFSSIFFEHSKDAKTFYQVSNDAKKLFTFCDQNH